MPSMDSDSGGSRPSSRFRRVRSYGFWGAKKGAQKTRTISTASAITEPLTVGRPLSFLSMAARRGVSASGCMVRMLVFGFGSAMVSLRRCDQLDPGVQGGVQEVDDAVYDHEYQGHQHHVGHHDRAVKLVDAVDEQFAHARPGEHGLGDGRIG